MDNIVVIKSRLKGCSDVVTAHEMMEIMGISKYAARKLINENQVESRFFDNKYYITKKSILAYIKKYSSKRKQQDEPEM